MPAPVKYSDSNVLTSALSRYNAIRVFPTRNKFNGTENNNGMNIHEFLSLMGSAQKQMNLSREEFLEFLLMCTTGKPHVLIRDWTENGNNIESIYYNLFVHYDMRMSPETARNKLFAYKAHKSSSLSKVTSEIMQLALRSACVHPLGIARTAAYNNDAVQALIKSLPPKSSDIVSNKYYTLTSKLGRICTFVELSRALQIHSHVINSDINLKGFSPVPPQKGFHKNGQTHLNVYYQSTSHDDYDEEDVHNDQDHTEDDDQELNLNENVPYIENDQDVVEGHFEDENSQNDDHEYNEESVHDTDKHLNEDQASCDQCGSEDHPDENSCPNIQDDWGNIVLIAPKYIMEICKNCPDLKHCLLYCPFRESGPLGPNSS